MTLPFATAHPQTSRRPAHGMAASHLLALADASHLLAPADASHLLALADDAQRIIFALLSDALRPAVVLELTTCCHELRAISKTARTELFQRHSAAKRLCARVNTSLAAMREMKELLWYGAGLTTAHLATLGQLLHQNAPPQLEVINISINRMGAEGMDALCERLGQGSLSSVRVLDLTSNALGSAGAATLAAAFSRGALPKLEVMKLGRNGLGDPGLSVLAPPLRRLLALKELHLYGNQIGEVGVQALLANLGGAQLQQLRTLNLVGNLINDAGCATLIAALDSRAPPPLEDLRIDENPRMSEAAKNEALRRAQPCRCGELRPMSPPLRSDKLLIARE